jgi:hypothetical protein
VRPTPDLLKVPFDEILLPSMGLFYSNGISNIKVRALTGYDEIMLCSPALSHSGNAIKILLNNVILERDLNYEDLLLCDRDAILLFLRSITYGDNMEMNFICPQCKEESKGVYIISSTEAKEMVIQPNEFGEFEYILPSSIKKENPIQINFTPIKVSQYNLIKDKQLMSRYRTQITSVNGNSDKKFIFKFLKTMPIKDSSNLREYMDKVEPGFEEIHIHDCPNCNHEFKDIIRIDESFMSLDANYRNTVNEECFLAYYYGKGISRNEAYEMPVIDRRWTINRISEEVEKKNKAEQEAAEKAKRNGKK